MANLENILYEQSLSQETLDFLEVAKLQRYNALEYGNHVGTIMATPILMDQILNHSNERSLQHRLPLIQPDPDEVSDEFIALTHLFQKRSSTRVFDEKNLSFQKLSVLLNGGYQFMDKPVADFDLIPRKKKEPTRRNIPSAGGIYSIDIYVFNLSVAGIPPGLYHYCARKSVLEIVPLKKPYSEEPVRSLVDSVFFSENRSDIDFSRSDAVVIMTSKLNRIAFKYKDRGLRYAYLEAGAIMQNIYLTAAAENIGVFACGGFYDDELLEILDSRCTDDVVLNSLVIGSSE